MPPFIRYEERKMFLWKLAHTDLSILNEVSNSEDSLNKALVFLEQAEEDVFAWKWVIIAIYQALQGFCMLALEGANPSILFSYPPKRESKKVEEALTKSFQSGGIQSKDEVIEIINILISFFQKKKDMSANNNNSCFTEGIANK